MRVSMRSLAHWLTATTLCVAGLAVVWAPAVGQTVRVKGRVIEDESELPIDGVRVTLISIDDRRLEIAYTDELGSFEFAVRYRSGVKLRADRIGYKETLTPTLHFDDHDFFRVEIRMKVDAVLLAPLEVVGRSRSFSPVHANFEHRRLTGSGWYITRSDIEELKPSYVTDLLATVPGVRLVSSGSGHRRMPTFGRIPGCYAQVYVDGFQINRGPGFTIDDVVLPGSVEGIEVYRGLATVPAEYLSPDAICGVVAIWTRRGS
ncbi:MAG: TonB-dependent receptor plug domain-containing protein [Gemmatimonadota bacterium]|nr:MAG: TonB-dependent receptor plug domain-containing protein [Gemmatimonadota bacterium]